MPARTARQAPASDASAPALVAESSPPGASHDAQETPHAAPAVQPFGYRGLKVWQKSMDLAATVYHVVGTMSDRVLADELWRTALAIPTNIAAGNTLYVRTEYVTLLSTAHGHIARLECLLHLADRLSLLPNADTAPLLAAASDIGRMLRALAKALQPTKDAEDAAA